ncbi:MAG: hypothetical protein M1445_18635 [Bacteroidetes bacterium]|nr:hypothetical protein [Bacteroidota bacterium]MCL6102990.1 hypothetical protein [Bacteroidota bacterium]
MPLFRIPGLSFSLNRLLGVTALKRKVAQSTGIPTTTGGIEKKIGTVILQSLFGKK